MRLSVSVAVVLLVGACTGNPVLSPSAPTVGSPGSSSAPLISPTFSPRSEATIEPPTPFPGSPEPTTAEPTAPEPTAALTYTYEYQEYDVPAGSHPHDVAPAPDGSVWYTGPNVGVLGRLDPATGDVTEIPLGEGSSPHGVIVGPDGAAWVTDSGLNAIVRVGGTDATTYPLPRPANTNLNTAAFDGDGILWFTGQNGVYGRVTPETGDVEVFDAPRGPGPYGISSTPSGDVWFVSLAGSYLAQIDTATDAADVFDPPTPGQGARRVWSDSSGRLWVSEWNAGQLGMYDPSAGEWREWPLPGPDPQAYSVYVDELDFVWLTDFGANTFVRFDPATEVFDSFPIPTDGALVRQTLGRDGELWGAESATDKLVVLRRINNWTIIN